MNINTTTNDIKKTNKEKHMKRTKAKAVLLLLGLLSGLGVGKSWATNTPVDATITVTPIVNVSLSISPTSYAYGLLAVNSSSITAAALTLSNNGDVDETVSKQIQSDPTNWIGDVSTTTPNHYILYVATSTTRPNLTDFTTGNHRFGTVGTPTGLKGLGGGSPIVTTSAGTLPSVNLWFRLDMPVQVTTSASQTITVRFTGTGQ
jgi:hypothetical protein